MHAHTPGPWYTIGLGVYTGSPQNDDIAHIASAHCYGVPGDSLANARLVAAAPELLAALQRAAGLLARYPQHDDAWAQARAAIARAIGEA